MPNLHLTCPVFLSGLGFLLLTGLSVKITRFCGKFFSEVAKSDCYLCKNFWGTWSFWDDITIHYSQKIIIHWCKTFLSFRDNYFRLVCWNSILRIQRKISKPHVFSTNIKKSISILDLGRTKSFKFWRKKFAGLSKTAFNLSRITFWGFSCWEDFFWSFLKNHRTIFGV